MGIVYSYYETIKIGLNGTWLWLPYRRHGKGTSGLQVGL